MGSSFFNVGLTGLNAAQLGLLTSGHNIANASTPGYNRQTIVQTTNTPQFTGAGFIGTGTNVSTIRRVYNEFVSRQVMASETNVAELGTYFSEIKQIDNLLADPSSGASPALQDFFNAIQAAAANPASLPARQALVSSGSALTARFQSLDQQLVTIREGINQQITASVGTINSLATQVGEINQRIILAEAAGPGQPANDLRDQRDQLIADLNKEIRVSVQVETSGTFSVFFGSGQPLVVGNQTMQLQTTTSPEDLTQVEVGLVSPNGAIVRLPEYIVSGGNLGGLLQFRSQTLDGAQNSLGRVALAIATTVNQQHRLGQDLTGALGGDLFQPISLNTLGASTNTGSATLAATLTVSDYRVAFNAGTYTVTRLSDNTNSTFTAVPIVLDGIRISLQTGAVANGDTFIVKPGEMTGKRVVGLSTNTGSAVLDSTGSNLQTLTASDYRLSLGAGGYLLTRLDDKQTWTGASLAAIMDQVAPQGFDLALTGTMAVGDSFLIRPTRYAARDMALAISDPRNTAAAQAMRTGAALTNAGTGTISAGTVEQTNVPLAANVRVTYEASSNSFVGFPVGSRVTVGPTTHIVQSPTDRIPYVAGANVSFNGVGVAINGAPANGDSFTIFPPPLTGGTASGAGTIVAGTVTETGSLPAAAMTLTYRQADGVAPARIEGFPWGTRVTVTQSNGTTTEYLIDPTTVPVSATVPFAAGATISFNGMSFVIAGAPVEGDKFDLGPNPSGEGDNRNLVALGGLQTAKSLSNGSATFQSSYAQIVSQVGNKTREIEVTLQAQENLVTQGKNLMQSQSGVNLDEEAANLLRYQQAYQAAAKMMELSSKLFDLLLNLGR